MQSVGATERALIDQSLRTLHANGYSLADRLQAIADELNAIQNTIAGIDECAYDPINSTGLNYYFKAGRLGNLGGAPVDVAAGYVALTAGQTNYVELDPDTGVVSKNTSGFTAGKIPLATVAAGASSFDDGDVTDKRCHWVAPGTGKITSAMMGTSAVPAAALASDAATSAKIQNGAVTAAKLADTVQDRIRSVSIAVATEAANAIDVTLQVKDANDNNLTGYHAIEFWLSDSATGFECTTAPDGGVSVQTGTSLVQHTANKRYTAQTDANGALVVRVTDSGTPTFYLRANLGGAIATSGAITFN